MVYHGHIRNGQIVLNDEQARLPEGAAVRVDVVSNGERDPQAGDIAPSLHERLRSVIGVVNDLPADASRNVDHYLYGHPRQ